MLRCPECKADEISVIDSRVVQTGKITRRRLECGNCSARFTSHEIREADLADTTSTHFADILEKIKSESRIPKPFRKSLKPKKKEVIIAGSWFRRNCPCCFEEEKDLVIR